MAKQTLRVSSSKRQIEFANGTVLGVAPFVGQVTQWVNEHATPAYRMPAEDDTGLELREALAEAAITEQETIQVDVTGAPRTRAYGARPENDRLVLQPKRTRVDAVQVVLYQDESGGVSWHFPDGFFEKPRTSRTTGFRALPRGAFTFTIPARTVKAQRAFDHDRVVTRGLLTKWGRKILKVLVIPLVSSLLADPLEAIVGAIERKYRQDLIRPLTPDNYKRKVTEPFEAWDSLAAGPALLVIHGIFSSTDGVLSLLPPAAMDRLYSHYQGRVIAFDHLSVSTHPEQNARLLLERLAAVSGGRKFRFDVLCHSRGGIVARTLTERGNDLVPRHPCEFGKVFFVATPNQGSALADPEHVIDMIDVFTNLLTNFPDGPAMYAIEAILAIIKLLAFTAGKELPGVAAMGTKGYIRDVLNKGRNACASQYAAAAANYEPDPGRDNAFFTGRFVDGVMDRIFAANGVPIANDLVVPCEGVFSANGVPLFPIANPLVYAASDHVWHSGFFTEARTLNRIYDHFGVRPETLAAIVEVGDVAGADQVSEADAAAENLADDVISVAEVEVSEVTPRGGFGRGAGRGAVHASGRSGSLKLATFGFRGDVGSVLPTFPGPAPRGRIRAARPAVRRGKTRATPLEPPPAGGAATGDAVEVAAPVLAPAVIQREPRIRFHETVDEGVTNELVISLADLVQAAGGGALPIPFEGDEQTVDLDVVVNAAGFQVDPAHATMTVGRDYDAERERVTFALTAGHPGPAPVKRAIHADFFLRNSCVGSVSHYTFVIPKNYVGPRPGAGETRTEPFLVAPVPREACEWVIYVIGDNSPYQLFISSNMPGDVFEMRPVGPMNVPGGELSAVFSDFLEQRFSAFPDPHGMTAKAFAKAAQEWQENFAQTIEAFGKQLWMYLPQTFRDTYFALYDKRRTPRSIQIHSTDMTFPWELVIPFRAGAPVENLKPLGVAHVLGRWKPGLTMKPPTSQILQVQRFCIMNPRYPEPDDLPFSDQERSELQKAFPGIISISPANLQKIRAEVLNRDDVQVLHFTGHGEFSRANADLSKLILEDGTSLDALLITGTKLCLDAQPVVYLNACSVGSVGYSVGRPAGFAAAFLNGDGQRGGCTGVIAPYWPINDARAKDFSVSFYRKLRMRRAVGEALQELRAENPSDPTFSAYAYFGDPWVRLNFRMKPTP